MADQNVVKLRPFKTISPIKWQDKHPPARDWLIEGVMLRKTVCLFAGAGALGKSILMLQLMTACAAGRPWLGMNVPRCRTFGMFCEDPEEEVWRRQEKVCTYYDLDYSDLEDVDFQTLSQMEETALYKVSGKPEVGKPTWLWANMVQHVINIGAQLVVIDNVNAVFDGNENFKEHVRPFLHMLTKLAHDIDGGVILIQHPSQSGDVDRSAKSGSRAWYDTVRSQMIIEYPKEFGPDDEPSDERILRFGKQNYGKRGKPMRIEWKDGVFVPCTVSDQQGGSLSMFDYRELQAKIVMSVRQGVQRGERFSVAKSSPIHVGTVLRKEKSWHRYAWEEIRSACDAMIKDGRFETVELGPPTKRVILIRPTDCRYPGEKEAEIDPAD